MFSCDLLWLCSRGTDASKLVASPCRTAYLIYKRDSTLFVSLVPLNFDLVLLAQDDEGAIRQNEQGIWDPFSAEDLLHKGIASQLEALQAISLNASKEYGLEKALDKMHADWEGVEFRIMEYKDTGTYIVGGTDDIQVMLLQLTCQH